MGTFKKFVENTPEFNYKTYGGPQVGENPQTAQVLGQVVRVLQSHARQIATLLDHHARKIGHGIDPNAYQNGNLNQADEKVALRNVSQGYQTLTGLIKKFPPNEQDRDLDLFVKELSRTIREGQSFTTGFRGEVNEEVFDMLKMNHQKMVRLLNEAHRFLSKSSHAGDFYRHFGQVQQHPVGGTGWQRGEDSVRL